MLRVHMVWSLAVMPSLTLAHDTWVQTNTPLIRVGDAVFIDLMLGNHGNEHRDFKLASKVDPAAGKTVVIAPSGKRYDLAEEGLRHANATYFDSHTTDKTSLLTYAMDLTPLAEDEKIDVEEYTLNYVRRLEKDVADRMKRFL